MKGTVTELSSQPKALPGMNGGLPYQHENPCLSFSNLSAELNLAKVFCRACPRRRRSLAGALERAGPTGVWGGEILEHGRIIESKRPRGQPREATFGGDQR
jgi:WhiB family transcriptional regulator, redox-sensing transcriptional regulator